MNDYGSAPRPANGPALLARRVAAHLVALLVFDVAVAGVALAMLLLLPWGPSLLFGDVIGYRVLGGGLRALLDARLLVAAPALAASFLVSVLSPGGRGPFLRVFGLTVVDEAGGPPSVPRRALRWAGLCLTTLALGLPAAWALLDEHGRAPHDILSGTRVLRARRNVD
ncbi:MAG: RDD family protein [Anaerolineae bacterium]|nr:RDD family protein [Coriobacteriia bacterium]MDI6712952.1 RDD family protein [Anaerosomatales bacterium]MDI7277402.1 RDD family protein [Anaerolineae bacterium]